MYDELHKRVFFSVEVVIATGYFHLSLGSKVPLIHFLNQIPTNAFLKGFKHAETSLFIFNQLGIFTTMSLNFEIKQLKSFSRVCSNTL